MNNSDNFDNPDGIAIIGMAGRFPGAKDVDQFWQNLRDGVESIEFFSDQMAVKCNHKISKRLWKSLVVSATTIELDSKSNSVVSRPFEIGTRISLGLRCALVDMLLAMRQ